MVYTSFQLPRRYGKTSLVLYVLKNLSLPYACIDLFVTLDESTVATEIIAGVNDVINQVMTRPELIVSHIKDILKHITTQWFIGTDGVKVQLSRKFIHNDARAIRDSLMILDKILQKKRKKSVLFIDEFQQIGVVANSKGIESTIRAIAEKSKNISFIFSGSNRHLLSSIFDDKAKPLYLLCDHIMLDRIDNSSYKKFINKVSRKYWGETLSDSLFNKLFELTELHPYYMNVLCSRLFMSNQGPISPRKLQTLWQNYLIEEKSQTAIDLSKLSLVQKKILIMIAHGKTTQFTTKKTLKKLNTSSSAVFHALKSLMLKDYISECHHSTYQMIDPLVASSINAFFPSEKFL